MKTLLSLLAVSMASLAAAAQELPYGHADFQPTPQRPLGWRGDPVTGICPAAQPPMDWNVAGGKGVLWKMEVGQQGRGGVIVVGGLAIALVDPDVVLAVGAEDGKERWRVKFDPTASMGAERAAAAAAWKTHTDILVRNKFANRTKWTPEDQAEFKKADLRRMKIGGYNEETGFACATPITDGKLVYASFRSGAVGAVNMDGTVAWQVGVGPLGSASPLLLAGKLVLAAGDSLIGLDSASGKEAWRTALPSMKTAPSKGAAGSTPAVVKVGGETLLATVVGDVIRPADGTVAGAGLFAVGNIEEGAIGHGDLVLIANGEGHGNGPQGVTAVRLKREGDKLTGEKVWESLQNSKEDKCGAGIILPVAYEGFVYSPMSYVLKNGLKVREIATGKIVGAERPCQVDFVPHWPDAAPVVAGQTVVLTTSKGSMIFVKPGQDWAEAARCSLGGMTGAAPCFIGKRIYTRTDTHMLCLGAK